VTSPDIGGLPGAPRKTERRAVLAGALSVTGGLAPPRRARAAPGRDAGSRTGPDPLLPFADARSAYLRTHRFFCADSPWNTRLGGRTGGAPASGVRALEVGLTSWSPTGGSVVIHFAEATDPLVPVLTFRTPGRRSPREPGGARETRAPSRNGS
jgi:hypothetical protein